MLICTVASIKSTLLAGQKFLSQERFTTFTVLYIIFHEKIYLIYCINDTSVAAAQAGHFQKTKRT
jgi:hypothetical protein